jgi:SM-20-related protein
MPDPNFFARLGLFVVKDFFAPELCARLRLEARSAARAQALAYFKGDAGIGIVDENFRRAKLVKVSKQTRRSVEQHLIAVKPMVEKHFNLPLGGCQDPGFLAYKEGDFFRPHRDISDDPGCPKALKERRVSVVIFLNDQSVEPEPDSYCGGSLIFYGLIDDPRWKEYGFPLVGERGLLIAFPSEAYHQVSTVTHGERYTIVSWFV